MAGYCGWSMSNNAVDAYDNGEMPMSKWGKRDIVDQIEEGVEKGDIELHCSMNKLEKLPLGVLREYFLERTSWHHTGKYYQETDFYSLNICYIEELTDEELMWLASKYKDEQRRLKEEKVAEVSEKWECSFLEWSGTRKHRKSTEIREIGTIKGNWFYRKNGHKKSLNARGFKKIRQILEVDAADNT